MEVEARIAVAAAYIEQGEAVYVASSESAVTEALRRLPEIDEVVPVVFGPGRVEGGGRGRSVTLYGVGWQAAAGWRFDVAQGRFLPRMDPDRRASFAVLGAKLSRELFDEASPLVEYDDEDTAEMERRLRGLGYVS